MRHYSSILAALILSAAACTSILGDDFAIVSPQQSAGGSAPNTGGGPAAPVCGNGDLESDESCDDGNTESNDGCDAQCGIEGTCEQPLALTEKENTASTIRWQIIGASGGVGQLGLAACDGSSSGAGSDRIYSFTLTTQRDVTITLSGDGKIVRLLSQPCELSTEVFVPGQADGCSSAGSLFYPELAAGSYFVVVDETSPDESGQFTLDVQATCPASSLRLSELTLGSGHQLILENASSSCSVDMNGFGLFFDDSSQSDEAVPLGSLGLLEAGARTTVGAAGSDLVTTAWQFDASRGGSAILCRGTCATPEADSIIDLLAFSEGEMHAALPRNATFKPLAITGITSFDQDYLSYQRTSSNATPPNFLLDDWSLGFRAPTVLYDSFEDGNYDGWVEVTNELTISITPVSDHGDKSLHVQGEITGCNEPATASCFKGLRYDIAPSQPSEITFSVRGDAGGTGYFMAGDSNVEGELGIAEFRLHPSELIITCKNSSGNLASLPIVATPSNWNTITYKNIDWTNKTFDLYLNGGPYFSDLGFFQDSLANIEEVHLFNVSDGFAQYDKILMTQ